MTTCHLCASQKTKKQAQGQFPGCLCLFFKAYFLCGVATNMCLARLIDHYSTFIPILVPEHQLTIKGIDEDGLVTTNLFGQYFLAQVVKHIALDGALNGPCTKLWVVAKVG